MSAPDLAPTDPDRTLAIVGGGFSGTMVAVHLLRLASGPLTIRLVEREARVGPGLAYGAAAEEHMLNVPAARMSALAEEPRHFLNWLNARGGPSVAEDAFVSRATYGEYLEQVLADAVANARPGLRFEVVQGEVADLRLEDRHARLTLADGRGFAARRVVLALGNFPPAVPAVPGFDLAASPCFVRDPWAPGALDGLDPDLAVLAVGSGLTMVDVALSLRPRLGAGAALHVVSRHGLLPQPHEDPLRSVEPYFPTVSRAAELVRLVRERVREAARRGQDWRSVVDGLRANKQALWQALPPAERRRFLRHARAYWEVHRHRVPAEALAAIARMEQEGRLIRHAGRLIGASEAPGGLSVLIRPRGGKGDVSLFVQRVINCTGPQTDVRRVDSPLLASLLEQGLARPDALGLGLDTLFNGALLGASGMPSRVLFTLGPLRKGALWETTAVPEIRHQAALLAREILGA